MEPPASFGRRQLQLRACGVACCLGSSGVTACIIKEDKVVAISAPGMLASDSDLDGDPLNAVLVSGPAHASCILRSGARFKLPGKQLMIEINLGEWRAESSPHGNWEHSGLGRASSTSP